MRLKKSKISDQIKHRIRLHVLCFIGNQRPGGVPWEEPAHAEDMGWPSTFLLGHSVPAHLFVCLLPLPA